MGAYTGLKEYFNGKLIDYAIKYNYNAANLMLLEENVDEESFKTKHLDTYANLISCNIQKDGRTHIEYGQDLVASWILEDYLLEQLQNAGVNVSLAGADKNRAILATSNTSTDADYQITTKDGKIFSVELVNDYSDFWINKHALHLRDHKFIRLKTKSSILLAITITNQKQKFAIYDFRNHIPAKYIPYHKPWHKPAFELKLPASMLHDFSISKVKEKLELIL